MDNKTKRLGGLFDGEVKHQAGSVWDKEGLCPALDTAQGGGRQPHIIVTNNSTWWNSKSDNFDEK